LAGKHHREPHLHLSCMSQITLFKYYSQKIIEEPSLVPLLELLEGRFSYCGLNPEIEKLMESEEAAKLEAQERVKQEKSEKCVLDEDMAERLGRLSKAVGLKFMSKRQRSEADSSTSTSKSEEIDEEQHRKRFKFMKPPSP
jgi:M-phase phosphoprotein 6